MFTKYANIFLQMVFVADTHIAEEQLFHKKPTVNKEKSLKF